MATGPGKNAILQVGTLASETDITPYVDKIVPTQVFDKNDTSVMGNFHSSVPGQYAVIYAFEGPWSPALHAILQPLRGVAGKSLVYGPQGTTSGNYKAQVSGWLQYEVADATLTAAVRYKCMFHGTSALAESTFP